MATFISTKQQESGIALGGIGTGSVELFPDGEFHQWQIANPPRWASVTGDKKGGDGEEFTGALSFSAGKTNTSSCSGYRESH